MPWHVPGQGMHCPQRRRHSPPARRTAPRCTAHSCSRTLRRWRLPWRSPPRSSGMRSRPCRSQIPPRGTARTCCRRGRFQRRSPACPRQRGRCTFPGRTPGRARPGPARPTRQRRGCTPSEALPCQQRGYPRAGSPLGTPSTQWRPAPHCTGPGHTPRRPWRRRAARGQAAPPLRMPPQPGGTLPMGRLCTPSPRPGTRPARPAVLPTEHCAGALRRAPPQRWTRAVHPHPPLSVACLPHWCAGRCRVVPAWEQCAQGGDQGQLCFGGPWDCTPLRRHCGGHVRGRQCEGVRV